MQNLEHILKHHNLRITQVRLEILQFFQTNKIALTHADLETFFSKKFDRVTIYRTLTSFLENGLLHKIPDDSGIAKIECLHNLEIPKLHLPKKYKMEHANLLIEGICAYCNP